MTLNGRTPDASRVGGHETLGGSSECESTRSASTVTCARRPPSIPSPVSADRVAAALEEILTLTADESMAAWAVACPPSRPPAAAPVNAAAETDRYLDVLRHQQHLIRVRLVNVAALADDLTHITTQHPDAAADPDVEPRLRYLTRTLPKYLVGQIREFDRRIGASS